MKFNFGKSNLTYENVHKPHFNQFKIKKLQIVCWNLRHVSNQVINHHPAEAMQTWNARSHYLHLGRYLCVCLWAGEKIRRQVLDEEAQTWPPAGESHKKCETWDKAPSLSPGSCSKTPRVCVNYSNELFGCFWSVAKFGL